MCTIQWKSDQLTANRGMPVFGGTDIISGDGTGFSWYYKNGLSDEMVYATFFDNGRPMPHYCGGSGCHACARMKGPNNEDGPYPSHPVSHMQCRDISRYSQALLSLVELVHYITVLFKA